MDIKLPSDTLNIGGIGVGGKGTSDLWNASIQGAENVVAMCDVDKGKQSLKSRERFPKANFYQDYREMLDKEKDLDAVTISSPDHMHAIQGSCRYGSWYSCVCSKTFNS